MLMLVTDRDESLRAFEAFKSAFTAGAALFPNHYVGFQGGHQIVNVHWHGPAGIWGVFEREPGIKRESRLAVFGPPSELTTRASDRRLTSRSK